jgi:hypothetical protein
MTMFIILRFVYQTYFKFPHFKIVKAGMQKWLNKTQPFTTYQIELKTKKNSDELVFEELWIDQKRYRFQLTRPNRKFAASFFKKEILKINVISEMKTDAEATPVKSTKGRLLLAYTFRNKRKYLSLKKLDMLDGLKLSMG